MTQRPGTTPHPQYRWDDVRLLLEIARTGSFNKAAKAFQIHQSTVSRRVAALEEALGGDIFDREPAFVGYPPRELTQLGELLFTRALVVEAAIQALEDEAKRWTEARRREELERQHAFQRRQLELRRPFEPR